MTSWMHCLHIEGSLSHAAAFIAAFDAAARA
jgi:hypothetical protein